MLLHSLLMSLHSSIILGLGFHVFGTSGIPLVAEHSAHLGGVLLDVHVSPCGGDATDLGVVNAVHGALGGLLLLIGLLLGTLGGASLVANPVHRALVLGVSVRHVILVVGRCSFECRNIVVVARIKVVVEGLDGSLDRLLALRK